jgi:anti-sigma regulatory factor (Ser/Thr protein kinase)
MQRAYRHEAFPYRGQDEFVASCLAVAEDAQAEDARVIFLTSAAKLSTLQDALPTESDDVALVPIDQHGRNPARITTMLDSFQASANGRPCVGVNESVFSGRTRAAFAEALFAESVLNSASLSSWPMSIICLYDTAALNPSCLDEMRRSHPAIHGQSANAAYEPELASEIFGGPLDPAPVDVTWRPVEHHELGSTRTYIREQARERELTGDRLEDLVLATNEIVTNSVRHAGGECRVAVWDDDESVICEVRDPGTIRDPLIGRLAPSPSAPAGRGLWLANHLCDLVQIRSGQQGTVVRLRVDYVT